MAETPPFNGNGTPGRLLACQVPHPPEKLKKRDGICDELLNRLRQDNEREHGWFYRTFIQGHGRPVGSGETPAINSALIFQRECKALPSEVDKSVLDDIRQKAQSGLPPEQSVKLKNDLNILQRVYQPGEYPDMALTSSEQAWVDEKNLHALNTIGMSVGGVFGIPGFLTRMAGYSEKQVAAANDASGIVFDLVVGHLGIRGGRGAIETPRASRPGMTQEPPLAKKPIVEKPPPAEKPPTEGTVVKRYNFDPPLPSRHRIRSVRQGGKKTRQNTVAESGINMKADVDAINAGQGTRDGNLYTVNGRTYELIGGDHLVPYSGPGFHPLTRSEFDALGIFNKFGDTPQAMEYATKAAGEAGANKALSIWRLDQ